MKEHNCGIKDRDKLKVEEVVRPEQISKKSVQYIINGKTQNKTKGGKSHGPARLLGKITMCRAGKHCVCHIIHYTLPSKLNFTYGNSLC